MFKSIIHPPVYSPLRGDVTALYIHQHVKRAPNISSNSTTLLFFHLCNRFSPQSADPLSLCALSFLGKKISSFSHKFTNRTTGSTYYWLPLTVDFFLVGGGGEASPQAQIGFHGNRHRLACTQNLRTWPC